MSTNSLLDQTQEEHQQREGGKGSLMKSFKTWPSSPSSAWSSRQTSLITVLLFLVASNEAIRQEQPRVRQAGSKVKTSGNFAEEKRLRHESVQHDLDDMRGLQQVDSSCVEYSAITTYCCGAPSKGDCKASGGTYSGPESPCEVLKVDVSAGPPVCTGFSEASGLLTQCSCGGGTTAPVVLPPPAPTVDPTSAPILGTLAPLVNSTPSPTLVPTPTPTLVPTPTPTLVPTPTPTPEQVTTEPVATSAPTSGNSDSSSDSAQNSKLDNAADLNAAYTRAEAPLLFTAGGVVGTYAVCALLGQGFWLGATIVLGFGF